MPTDVLTGLHLKPLIEINGFLDQPAKLIGKGIERDQPGCMPGGARGKFRPLDEAGIRPASMRQAIKNVGADTSASDDNDPCM